MIDVVATADASAFSVKYVIGGSTVKYLSCKLGWCNNCKGIVAVEDFGDCNTDYEEIRDLADRGFSRKLIAHNYKISVWNVEDIISRKTWTHI